MHTTGKLKLINHGNSVITISPGGSTTLTNPVTGASVTVNIAGSFHERTLANGDLVGTATGHNLFGGPSVEGILYTTGNVSYRIDGASGAFTSGATRGTVVDLCDRLG